MPLAPLPLGEGRGEGLALQEVESPARTPGVPRPELRLTSDPKSRAPSHHGLRGTWRLVRWAIRFLLSKDGDVVDHGRIQVLGGADFRILVAGALQLLEEHAPELYAQAQAGVTRVLEWPETDIVVGTGKWRGTAQLLLGPDAQDASSGVAVYVASAALAARAEGGPPALAERDRAGHEEALSRLAARLAEAAPRPSGPKN